MRVGLSRIYLLQAGKKRKACFWEGGYEHQRIPGWRRSESSPSGLRRLMGFHTLAGMGKRGTPRQVTTGRGPGFWQRGTFITGPLSPLRFAAGSRVSMGNHTASETAGLPYQSLRFSTHPATVALPHPRPPVVHPRKPDSCNFPFRYGNDPYPALQRIRDILPG